MKTNKLFNLMIAAFLVVFATSCVQDDEYTIPSPDGIGVEPNFSVPISSIENIKNALNQNFANNQESKVIFNDDDQTVFEGYVISSDYAGNFYKSITLQDSPSNPSHGIEVLIDKTSLFESFEVGRKVYIKMAGLTVFYEDGDDDDPSDTDVPGRYIVGVDGSFPEEISQFTYESAVVRSTEVATITPTVVAINDLTQDHINTFIQLSNVQFDISEIGKTYAGEASDQYDGSRTILNCDSNATIGLESSTFSDFKSYPISDKVGNLSAVLAKNFEASTMVLIINDLTNVDFTGTDRCDPVILDCGTVASPGTMNLFMDDFESQTNNALISGNGWTNYIEAGSEGWEAYTSGGTNSSLGRSARMGAYNSGDNSNIAWLVTPAINFDAQEGETLNFKTSNSFSDNSTLDLLFSTDWDGTAASLTAANWGVLPAAYIVQDTDFFGSWEDSGIVDLSCATGTMYIAFKYTGGDQNDFTGTYELDEITIDYTP